MASSRRARPGAAVQRFAGWFAFEASHGCVSSYIICALFAVAEALICSGEDARDTRRPEVPPAQPSGSSPSAVHRGPASTTPPLDAIAREVGVSRRTLFRYYRRKNDIPWDGSTGRSTVSGKSWPRGLRCCRCSTPSVERSPGSTTSRGCLPKARRPHGPHPPDAGPAGSLRAALRPKGARSSTCTPQAVSSCLPTTRSRS